MSDTGTDYIPSASDWVRKQVEKIDATGDTRSVHIMHLPVVMLTMRGKKTGGIRKVPLMRVEHEGRYAAVASLGGSPKHPVWYHNVLANPQVELQDGTHKQDMVAREVTGEEKALWWERCVAAFPDYADYQEKTDREIPVFVLEPTPV